MWPREVKGGIHVTTLELKLEFLHLILIFFPTVLCCLFLEIHSLICWVVHLGALSVKGSIQMVINGELQLMAHNNTAHTTKEFAFTGSSPNLHILMLCQQLLSLTSDCAGNIRLPETKSFTWTVSKEFHL